MHRDFYGYMFEIAKGSPLWGRLNGRKDHMNVIVRVDPDPSSLGKLVYIEAEQTSDLPFHQSIDRQVLRPLDLGVVGFDQHWEDEDHVRRAQGRLTDNDLGRLIADFERVEEEQFRLVTRK